MFRNKYSGMSIIGPGGMERDLSRRGKVRGAARVDPRRGLPAAEESMANSAKRAGGFMSGVRGKIQNFTDNLFRVNMEGFGATSGVASYTTSRAGIGAGAGARMPLAIGPGSVAQSSASSARPMLELGPGRSAASNRLESHLRSMPKQGTKMRYRGPATPVSIRRPEAVPVTMGATRPKTPFKGLEASVATSEAKAMQRATPTPISISGVRQGGKMRPLKAPAPTPKPKSSVLGGIGDFFMKEGKMTTKGKIGLGVAAAVAAGVVMNRRDKGVRPAGPGGY